MECTKQLNYDEIIEKYHSELRIFIRSQGVSEACVDDLAQEVFLFAYRKQAEFVKIVNRKLWLRTVARNLVRADRTKRARRYRLMNDRIADVLINLGMENEDLYTLPENVISALKGCVKKLPDSQRSLLSLRYNDGHKVVELAEKLSQKPATVRKKLQRIRDAIRQCMEKRLGKVSLCS